MLRTCKMTPITNYNPNGSSDSSHSVCSGSHSAGNTRYDSQPTPSINGNRNPNVLLATNIYTSWSVYSVSYQAGNDGYFSYPTPSVNGYDLQLTLNVSNLAIISSVNGCDLQSTPIDSNIVVM